MCDEVTVALEVLANRFVMAGDTVWTTLQIAEALRRYAVDRDAPLTNREEED